MFERREERLRLLLLPGESRGDGALVGEGGVVGEFGVAIHRLRRQVNGVGRRGLIGCCAALLALFTLFALDGGVRASLREVGVGGELPQHVDGGLRRLAAGVDHFAARVKSHEPEEGVLGARRAGVLLGEDAAGVGGEVEVAGAEVSGGEFVEQVGGDGVVERPRHLDDLSERRRLAAAVAGELADNFDLFGLFGGGGLIGEGVDVDRGVWLGWRGGERGVVAGLGDFFGEGLGVGRSYR